jgi:hypothetical protein
MCLRLFKRKTAKVASISQEEFKKQEKIFYELWYSSLNERQRQRQDRIVKSLIS